MMKKGNHSVSGNKPGSGEKFDLPHFGLFSVITKDYEMLDRLRDFSSRDNFVSRCRSFLRNTSCDHNNGSYMDPVIKGYISEGDKDIDLQIWEHDQLFGQSVEGSQKGTMVKLEAIHQMLLEAIEENDKELAKCKKVYFKGTSMED